MKTFSSTKTRITAWFVGVLAAIMILLSCGFYLLFESALRDQTDSTLMEIAVAFETSVASEMQDEDIEQEGKTITEAVIDSIADTSFKNYKLIVLSNTQELITENRNSDRMPNLSAEQVKSWFDDFTKAGKVRTESVVVHEESFRVLFRSFDVRGEHFYLLVIHPQQGSEFLLEKIRFALFIILPLALLSATLGGYFLVRKSLMPIREMTRKAEDITAQNLHERLPVENEQDEFGRLSLSFNRLLARLNLSFEQQQRFIADASHELRTPVAIIRGEADVSLTKIERKTSDYRDTIGIIQNEADRMSIIIEDLFTLTRADAGENPLRKSDFYLASLLGDEVKAFRTLAAKRGIEIILKTSEDKNVHADPQLVQRLVANLVDNAVKHAKTTVVISIEFMDGEVKIVVSDDGDGIKVESQPHIFERFYRADTSRSRQIDSSKGSGAGLGLSIAKWIAEMHKGTIELSKSDRQGTSFTVVFPIAG